MISAVLRLIFPPKCIFCRRVLLPGEQDICKQCQIEAEEYPKSKFKISFVAGWTALWYYKGNVRNSILRFKFRNVRSYGKTYGRFLAQHLPDFQIPAWDIFTWAPISMGRKLSRGYDQVELIAKAMGRQLGISPVRTLQKIRHTPPQSGIADYSARKANVLGAYRLRPNADVAGKRILLLDDVITTGATVSECARVLLTAGAKEVYCIALAAASHDKK